MNTQVLIKPEALPEQSNNKIKVVHTNDLYVYCTGCGQNIPLEEWPDHRDRLRKIQLVRQVNVFQQTLTRLIGEFLMWILRSVYFREVTVVGSENIPKTGAVVFYGNHQNQFIDALMMNSHCGRPVRFIMAEKSFHEPVIGTFGRMFNSVPVVRPQDIKKTDGAGWLKRTHGNTIIGEGTKFLSCLNAGDVLHWKITIANRESTEFSQNSEKVRISSSELNCSAQVRRIISNNEIEVTIPIPAEYSISSLTLFKISPRIDHSEMYAEVYDTLMKKQCIGIFPEGGSHDHTSLLPLKAGVALFSLGAAERHIDVKIVPCGLTYFYGHKFRSRAYIEFGEAITPPSELVNMFSTDKRKATGIFLEKLNDALRSVTINVPDWNTLKFLHAFRQLYQPVTCTLAARDYLRLTRRLSVIVEEHQDEADMREFRLKVENYIDYCHALLVRDSQAATLWQLNFSDSTASQVQLLFRRAFTIYLMFVILVPFFVVGLPLGLLIEYLAKKQTKIALQNSKVKIVGADVQGSFKVLFGFILVPLHFFFISVLVYFFTNFHISLVLLFSLPMSMYVSLLILQEAIMELRAALPLFMSIISNHKQFKKLYEKREHLAQIAAKIVEKYDIELHQKLLACFTSDASLAQASATSEDDLEPQPSLFSLRYSVRRRHAVNK